MTVTDYDLSMAKDVGSLQADVRTVKHDIASISSKIDGLSLQISKVTSKQDRGLGFFAGSAFIFTACGGALIGLAKMIFEG